MGYKDDLWEEAPGYCVECGSLAPLNKAAVCEKCWNEHPVSWGKCWEEDEYKSRWYYDRLATQGDIGSERGAESSKREYIVYGDYACCCPPPREDFKILGFVIASTPAEALQVWKASEEYKAGVEYEDEVYVMLVEGTRWVFNFQDGSLAQIYRRAGAS